MNKRIKYIYKADEYFLFNQLEDTFLFLMTQSLISLTYCSPIDYPNLSYQFVGLLFSALIIGGMQLYLIVELIQ
jgi:hypothetical protein